MKKDNTLFGICVLITSFIIVLISQINLSEIITKIFYGISIITITGIIIYAIIKVIKSNQN